MRALAALRGVDFVERTIPVPLIGALVYTYLTSTIGSVIAGVDLSVGLLVYAGLLAAVVVRPYDPQIHRLAFPAAMLALVARTLGFLYLFLAGAYNLGGSVLIWVTVLYWATRWHKDRVKVDHHVRASDTNS